MDKNYDFLISEARSLIRARYQKNGHHTVVAVALLTTSGKVYTSLNVGTYQPSISTCAEIIAIGMALRDDPHFKIEAIAAVRDEDGYLITPCGKCREYIADYSDDALVLVPNEIGKDEYSAIPVSELLPYKYKKITKEI